MKNRISRDMSLKEKSSTPSKDVLNDIFGMKLPPV
jgi:hypothetical protein